MKLGTSAILLTAALAAQNPASDLTATGRVALATGQPAKAITLATQAVAADAGYAPAYLLRVQAHEAMQSWESAIADYDKLIKLHPEAANLYNGRGAARFRLGHIDHSIADFDQAIALDPAQAPQHWQRGISLYYARRYEDGRRQFESHQTVNPSDVENAAWHFLCVARSKGPEAAKASLLPIAHDARVPMREIYALFGGAGKEDQVMSAARAGNPAEDARRERLFYAHLYIGLYNEALGQTKAARQHIERAERNAPRHYMGDVARVHLMLLRAPRSGGGAP